jgi:uncharacterized protein (UPF0262 family)
MNAISPYKKYKCDKRKEQLKVQQIKSKSKFGCNLQNQMKNMLNCFFIRKRPSRLSQKKSNLVSFNTKDYYLKNLIQKKKSQLMQNKIIKKKTYQPVKTILPPISKRRCVSFELDRVTLLRSKEVSHKKSLGCKRINSLMTYQNLKEPSLKVNSGPIRVNHSLSNSRILSAFKQIKTIHQMYLLSVQVCDRDYFLIYKAYDKSSNQEVIIKQFPTNLRNSKIQQQMIKVNGLIQRTKLSYFKD